MVKVYYNEIDEKAAAWLAELMKQGAIPHGTIDTRSIEDVRPSDLDGYDQCHFFAGIGGWAYALELAEWGDRPIWTASCPCQPFSAAGRRRGTADERHLWPALRWLIQQHLPSLVVGEQVASPAGREWFDALATDVEALSYRCAAAILPAASVKAPHLRDRIWWTAVRGLEVSSRERLEVVRLQLQSREPRLDLPEAAGRGEAGELADADGGQPGHRVLQRSWEHRQQSQDGRALWDDADWLYCRDGKYRPVEPGTFPLAHGIPARVGRLRGYGNAIVPQVAAAFLKSVKEELCDASLN